MKRIFFLVVMVLLGFVIGGCASNEQAKIMKDYSFGHQSFGTASSRITMLMPFEIAQVEGKPWMSEVGKPGAEQNVAFRGLGQQITILVSGSLPDAGTPFMPLQQMAENSILNLKQAQANTNVKANITTVQVDGVEARKVEATYVQGKFHVGMIQYLFINKGVLWNVIYLYPTDQAESLALVKYVEGKIQIDK